jgi:hypothetical protein
MSDIVERLMNYRPADEWGAKVHHTICTEAAGEIQSLRKERDDYKADYFRRHKEAGDRMERALVAEARCAMLEKALAPFASVAHAILSEAPPSAGNVELFTDCEGNIYRISLDDIRGICAALRHTTAEESKV